MNALIRKINEHSVAPGTLAIWWIGQEGFVFKSPDLIIYIDPYLSNYAERITAGQANEHVRINPAPMRPEDVNHADLIFCTHDHADHIDPYGIPLIAKASPDAQFMVPECARTTMLSLGIESSRIHTLRGEDSFEICDVRAHAIPAKHEEFDKDPIAGYPYLSYILEIDGHSLLHAGDTIPYPGQVERMREHRIDLAFVPINGRDDFRHSMNFEGNFTCEEAVEFALAIDASVTIPMHYDTFTLNTADVTDFRRIADRRGLRYIVMEHGGLLLWPNGGIEHA